MKRKPFSALMTTSALAILLAVTLPVTGQEQGNDENLPPRGVVIDIDAPERSLYRVAVPNLLGTGSLGAQGAEVIRNDFRLISLFEVLDSSSFVADLSAEGLGITPASWNSVGAQGVIKGQIQTQGQGIQVQMRFFQVANGASPALSRRYEGSQGELRSFMHQFANEVVELLTGQAGPFGSRLTFSRRIGHGRKDVFVSSFDGSGVRRVSSGTGIAMLPSFGGGGVWYSVLTPTGMFITRSGTGDRPIVGGDGLHMGVSVCGGRMYFSSTRDGNSEIYSAGLDGSGVRRLTRHPGIDVSPACGGPGGRVAFVSSRHGSPQIFTMSAGGGDVRRVTFRGSYNQTPAWCPDPQRSLLAFTGRAGGLDIFTVDTESQRYTRLTQGQGRNKDPAFSPDCRMVAFYSTRGGIYISNPEGLNQQRILSGHAETIRWSR